MRKFRRQHEQLRNVILRVLRPQAQQQQQASTPDEEEADNKGVCDGFIYSLNASHVLFSNSSSLPY